MILVAFYILCASINNGSGVFVIKLSSAANASLMQQARIIVIWIFFLLWPGQGHETFNFSELAGLLLVMLGIWGFNFFLLKQDKPTSEKPEDYSPLSSIELCQ